MSLAYITYIVCIIAHVYSFCLCVTCYHITYVYSYLYMYMYMYVHHLHCTIIMSTLLHKAYVSLSYITLLLPISTLYST